MIDRNEWIKGLKPGDVVAINSRATWSRAVVERSTKTQLVVKAGPLEMRFRMSDGMSVGGDAWSSSGIWEMTAEIAEKIERRVLVDRLSSRDWVLNLQTSSVERLRAIYAAANSCGDTE